MTDIVFSPKWQEVVNYSPEAPKPQVLMSDDNVKVIMAGLEPGQKIPAHPEAEAVYHFLEGSGWMYINGERMAISAGTTIIMPAGTVRGVEAETRLAFMAARIE